MLTNYFNIHYFLSILIGEIILADGGFTCDDYARMAMAEIDWSRELSAVCIHVECIIGVLKQQFTILPTILPISLIADTSDSQSTVNEIV